MRPLVLLLAALATTVVPSTSDLRRGIPYGVGPDLIERATLEVPYLLIGQNNVVTVHDAPGGEAAELFGATHRARRSACLAGPYQGCLDLPGPTSSLIAFSSAQTDDGGSASFDIFVSSTPSSVPLRLQAAGHGESGGWVSNVTRPRLLEPDDDEDDDGLSNGLELAMGTHPEVDDTDGDGLLDGEEVHQHGTDPLASDSDDGGVDDGAELAQGTDPLMGDDDHLAPPATCGPTPSLLLDGTPTATGYTLTTQTVVDEQDASCGTGLPSAEVGVLFTAPTAGTWHLTTEGSTVDTTLSVRTTCEDVGTELACLQDARPDAHAEVWVDLAKNETVALLIERAAGLSVADVTITAEPEVPPAAPVIMSASAVCPGPLGLVVTGEPGDRAVVSASVVARTEFGQPLPWPDGQVTHVVDLQPDEITEAPFSLTWRAVLTGMPAGTHHVDVAWHNGVGMTSEFASTTCGPTTVLFPGSTCDIHGLFNTCSQSTCVGDTTHAVCTVTEAPTLVVAEARYRDDLRRLGLQVLGMDADGDVTDVAVTLLDAGLAPLTVSGSPYPALIGQLDLDITGDVYAGTTVATLPPSAPTLGLGAVALQVRDAAGNVSDETIVRVSAPAMLESEGQCDVTETFGRCPQAEDCLAPPTDPEAEAHCAVAPNACPPEWDAAQVTDEIAPGVWTATGDATDADWLTPAGTCGGAGPQQVFTYTAPHSGIYRVAAVPDVLGATPTLMVRTRCEAPTADRELTCAVGTPARSGRLIHLQASQTVAIVVGGISPTTDDGSVGSFTLSVTSE